MKLPWWVLHEAQGPHPLTAPVGHVVKLGLPRGSLSGAQLPKGPASPLAVLLARVAPRPCLSFPEAPRVSPELVRRSTGVTEALGICPGFSLLKFPRARLTLSRAVAKAMPTEPGWGVGLQPSSVARGFSLLFLVAQVRGSKGQR